MKKIIAGILALVIFSTSCEDTFNFDVNESPNNPNESTLEYTLPTGISGIAYVMGGWYNVIGQIWSQHWTQAPEAQQYRTIEQYNVAGDYNWQFTEIYTSLADLEYVSEAAQAEENWNYFLIAEAMQAYTFQVMADLFDEVPYSEALRGDEGIIAPRYDEGSVIYDSLIIRLNNALAKDFDQSRVEGVGPTPVGSEDLIFGGDIEQWIRFANTLKLKIYLRQVYARPEEARAGIAELYAGGAEFLTTNAAMTQFTNSENRRNPFYETEVATSGFGNVNIVASQTIINYLVNNNDPRLNNYFEAGTAGYVGLEQGYYNIPGGETDEYAQPRVFPTDPVYLITAAESYFLQAEAAVRFPELTGGANAEALYQAGIEAAFDRVAGLYELAEEEEDPTDTDPSELYGEGGVYEFPEVIDEQIEAIATQKWISMTNIQGIESFLEFNRTGYPSFFIPSRSNITGDRFPRRLQLPTDERAENPNAPAFEEVYVPVWWDVEN